MKKISKITFDCNMIRQASPVEQELKRLAEEIRVQGSAADAAAASMRAYMPHPFPPMRPMPLEEKES